MKMVKSLILGTAVAFAATAGAQAADLPVKAKPVSYVKICPQYGPTFYYIPGTDICLKVGGLGMLEFGYINGNFNAQQPITNANGVDLVHNRVDNDFHTRMRVYLTLDARQQTAYGTLRVFMTAPFEAATTANGAAVLTRGSSPERAFLQFAGFTVGLADSFFSFGNNFNTIGMASVPWTWTNVIAYTAQFGNGFSATISVEDTASTRAGIRAAAYSTAAPAGWASVQAGQRRPDIVGNLRVDGAWGSAQVMAAWKELTINAAPFNDTDGYAIGAGIKINLPMIAPGDSLVITGVYADGAIEYTGITGNPLAVTTGIGYRAFAGGAGASSTSDAVFDGAQLLRNEAWSLYAGFEHFFTPAFRVAVFAGYTEVRNDAAIAAAFRAPDLEITQVGTRITWSPVTNLNIALDLLWTEIDTTAVATQAAGSVDVFSSWVRITRPF
jgi:hypothetical protein